MTEQQKFTVIRRIGPIEIRKYEPCVIADVEVRADFTRAGNIGFGPLVSYISQNNIAMTAPVLLEPTPSQSWIVSFVMPAGASLDRLPVPAGSRVTLREEPEHTAAALRFSGFTSEEKVSTKEKELRAAIAAAGLTATGAVRIARFDPPWKPGFLRHNEVVLPVDGS